MVLQGPKKRACPGWLIDLQQEKKVGGTSSSSASSASASGPAAGLAPPGLAPAPGAPVAAPNMDDEEDDTDVAGAD